MKAPINYRIIRDAKAGKSEALEHIVRHYTPYIKSRAKRIALSQYDGKAQLVINDQIVQRLKDKLLRQVYFKFDINRLPKGETLDE